VEKSTTGPSSRYSGAAFIHYRLGDLLTLEEKSPIPKERLSRVLGNILDLGFADFVVDSDSPEIAVSNIREVLSLSGYIDNTKISLFNGSLLEFISTGIEANVFVGTNSKISIWIALFRVNRSIGMTFLPKEIAVDFHKISSDHTSVSFY
jgi:hypothetical protein